jgi:hypothetical protein
MSKKLVLGTIAVALLITFVGCEIEPDPVTVTVAASEEIDSSEIPYAKFVYSFNQDVGVDSIHVDYPDSTISAYVVPDSEIEASYSGETDYDFPIYRLEGTGYTVYKGTYTVNIWGIRTKDDEPFELSQEVTLQ